jgi:hypothetical protein
MASIICLAFLAVVSAALPIGDFRLDYAMTHFQFGIHSMGRNNDRTLAWCVQPTANCNSSGVYLGQTDCTVWSDYSDTVITQSFVNVTGMCQLKREVLVLQNQYNEVIKIIQPYLYVSIGIFVLCIVNLILDFAAICQYRANEVIPDQPGSSTVVIVNQPVISEKTVDCKASAPSSIVVHQDPQLKYDIDILSDKYNVLRRHIKFDIFLNFVIIGSMIGVNLLYNLPTGVITS